MKRVVIDPQNHQELWNEYQARREQGLTSRRALRDALDALATETAPSGHVAIDPEDREQVERFCAVLPDFNWYGTPGLMQAALREFANPTPPKPEVWEHLPLQQRGKTVESVCGKAWIPSPDVTVVGKCPVCVSVAEGGWVA